MKPQDVQYKMDHAFRNLFIRKLDNLIFAEIQTDVLKPLDDSIWSTLHNKFYYNIAAELNMRVQEDVLCE